MLVESHLHAAHGLAAGVASLPGAGSAFAATQAAWRFLNNERVTLSALAEPLRAVARQSVARMQSCFALLVHDWCKVRCSQRDKRDVATLTHAQDVGYELNTALLVSADDGHPVAPMELHLKTAQRVLSTRDPAPQDLPHLEQVLPTMQASRTWGLAKPLLHVLDREADSVDHYRRWDAAGEKFLVRADQRRVQWQGQSYLLGQISDKLQLQQAFRRAGEATYRGRPAQLWVAETEVVLERPARKNVRGQRFERAGPALPLRFVMAQVRDGQRRVLAEWMLLSNAPPTWATSAQLARCYYWRWRIEDFFKLLKSHGQQVEQWRQERGAAIARRLLVAAMACVVVWQLQADDAPQTTQLKDVLVRLSGRQTKRKRPHTAPALLAGLWVLLAMLALLEHYDLDQLKHLTAQLPYLDTG